MEQNTNPIVKRIAMLAMAIVLVLTTVLMPTPAKAADTSEGVIVSKYTLGKGEKWTLTVYGAPDDASKPTYKSNKKSVATVNKNGVIKGRKPGKATITVTWKEGDTTYKAKSKITVKKAITYADGIKRIIPELNIVYSSAYYYAQINNALEDADTAEYLNAWKMMVDEAETIAANPKNYTDEEIEEALETIDYMCSTVWQILPQLVTASE